MTIKRTALTPISGPLLARLHEAGFPPGQAWDAPFFAKLLALPTTRGELLTVDDDPAAFVLWQHGPDAAEVYTVVVTPPHRRQGLARALLSVAETAMAEDGIQRVILDVAIDNPAAHTLYAQSGYAEIARRKAYYQRDNGHRADAIVMEKKLVPGLST